MDPIKIKWFQNGQLIILQDGVLLKATIIPRNFSIEFSPDDSFIYVAGMGSTRDPAAGNGKPMGKI